MGVLNDAWMLFRSTKILFTIYKSPKNLNKFLKAYCFTHRSKVERSNENTRGRKKKLCMEEIDGNGEL
jgi:hypothetical protein